jgi:hypothetical protein
MSVPLHLCVCERELLLVNYAMTTAGLTKTRLRVHRGVRTSPPGCVCVRERELLLGDYAITTDGLAVDFSV